MFPQEIIAYPQWIAWKATNTPDGKPTKLPYSPVTGKLASVSDPASWSDYNTACSCVSNSNGFLTGIGFVLTDNDPFCFIDLDDPQGDQAIADKHVKIMEAFDTYSEVSPSGKGVHLICKAKIISGTRRNKVEIYSSQRYMTMTGQTFHDKPIAERQEYAEMLWRELYGNGFGNSIEMKVVSEAERAPDEMIYNIAANADNGDKFCKLWRGEWQEIYKSQSEADFALINIIGFYSRNVEQIRRMFLLSELGKREKSKRKSYVDAMIKRSFDNQVPMIPLETLAMNAYNDLANKEAEAERAAVEVAAKDKQDNVFAGPLFANVSDPNYDWTMPPGLLGEITQYIYTAAPRPVKEIALAAAIGLMSGICGRSYNISGTGLNQYVLILAKTGTGKEAAANGIDRLMEAVKRIVPSAVEFIGPADIASGPALVKHLSKNPCFVSIVGEFGLMMQQMCSPSANASQVSFRRILLRLYNKSGQDDVLRQSIYSDKDKNTEIVRAPSFSMLGEATPDSFYTALDEAMIAEGLLPRFTCIEYLGIRPPLNPDHQKALPAVELVGRVGELVANCSTLGHHNKTINCTLDAEADKLSASFNIECDGLINTSELEVSRQLWNRAHMKVLKLSALIAIGQNPYQPVVTFECMQWAINLVKRDVLNILKQFETGKAGKESGELNQLNDVIYAIHQYIKTSPAGLKSYGVLPEMHKDCVVALQYLQRKLLQKTAFKNDRVGATFALKRAIDSLKSEGAIREVREIEIYQRYGRTAKAYVIADMMRFG